MGAVQSTSEIDGVSQAEQVYLDCLAWALSDSQRNQAAIDATDLSALARACRVAGRRAVQGADAVTWANAALEIRARNDGGASSSEPKDQKDDVPDFGEALTEAEPDLHALQYAFSKYRGSVESSFWMIYRHTLRQQLPEALSEEGIDLAKVMRKTDGAVPSEPLLVSQPLKADGAKPARPASLADTAAVAAPAVSLVPLSPDAVIPATLLATADSPDGDKSALECEVEVSSEGLRIVPVAKASKAISFSVFHILNFAAVNGRFVFQATADGEREMRVYTLSASTLGIRLLDAAVRGAIEIKLGEMNEGTKAPVVEGAAAAAAEPVANGNGETSAAEALAAAPAAPWCATQ